MCRNDCKVEKYVHPNRVGGIWSGFVLLLVPKCPFCFMAFSSVLVFCGENGTGHSSRHFYSSATLILSVIFCLTALLSIIFYYRPHCGKYALLLTVPGAAFVLVSVAAGGGMPLYYTGAALVMTGLLRNSGFWSIIQTKFTFQKNLRTHNKNITFSG
jgi:hypothetical protein